MADGGGRAITGVQTAFAGERGTHAVSIFRFGSGRAWGFLRVAKGHFQQMDSPVIGPQHLKVKSIQVDDLAPARQPAQFRHHQPADSVSPFVAEFGLEMPVELLNRGQRPDDKGVALGPDKHAVIGGVVFVVFGIVTAISAFS